MFIVWYTVSPHQSQILYVWNCILAKMFVSKNQYEVIFGHEQWKFWVAQHSHSQLNLNMHDNTLPSFLASSHTANKFVFSPKQVLFVVYLVRIFLLLVIFCLKWPPSIALKCTVSVPKEEKTVLICLKEICMSNSFVPGMSYIAVGNEFSVSESTIY